ncbi:Transposon Tf2-6 polyprotein [Merluccius polli]|uniref:Gypsy retrotransposon integrase-like protein 1 n=1 Tax=Merluccius polli TaxID=89951 RepID=A0AA47P329_MERPO|nr:Transposon Tf2-6 polyprotein [Merluccius polli]
MSPGALNYAADQSVFDPSLAPTASSTPLTQSAPQPTQVVPVEALGALITDLAKKIGDTISANLSTMQQPSTDQTRSSMSQSSSDAGLSQLKVLVQSDTKAPPYFRGDHTDLFSVHEWEDMMNCYLKRVKCDTPAEMYDLIMSRLTGRARDVVKVSLRSRSGLSASDLPLAVFDILKRNFSELSYSSLPMRDFYSTVPRVGESAMDYWIRLNKSIDAADECLRRRGKSVEDPSTEVVMMFINHCPDPSLAMSFQLKAPEQWTAAEVQERLDSHTRRVRRATAQTHHAVGLSAYSQSPVTDSFNPFSSGVSQGASDLPPAATIQPAAESGVQQVVAMFDKVLSLCNASLATGQRVANFQPVSRQPAQRQFNHPRNQQRSGPSACRVCGSSDHSTHAHCRRVEVASDLFYAPVSVGGQATLKGQRDKIIIGSNVIRPLIQELRSDEKYWELIRSRTSDPECEQFLQLLSCITRWSGPELPERVGTVMLRQAVTLAPQQEYLVWGKLPGSAPVSPGSTVIVEPTSSRSAPKDIIVGRVVAPMWGDRWVPMKILNPTMSPVTLRRGAKVADVFPCVAVEDLPISQGVSRPQSGQVHDPASTSDTASSPSQQLKACGLADIDLEGCDVSHEWRERLADLVLTYQDVFSKDKLDYLMKDDGCTPSQRKVKSFLGMVLYYQHFIPGCSSIARPLYTLTAGQKRKAKGSFGRRKAGTFRELTSKDWTPACEAAFESLKNALLNSVVLSHPDFDRPFILSTDASLDGLGAVLSQVLAGEERARPIAFASKSLTRTAFNGSLSADDVSSILSSSDDWDSAPRQRAASLADHLTTLTPSGQDVLPSLSLSDLQSHQQRDSVISRVTFYVERKRRPSRRERCNESQLTIRLLRQWEKLTFLNGILYRVTKDPLSKHKRFQFIVPDSLKANALSGVDHAGHQGQPRMLSLARQRFFWYDMERDVRNHVRCCHRCVLSKTPEPSARAPLESIKTTAPLELVCVDFWSAEGSDNKSVDVLVITDHFTKLAHAFPCQDQTARRVAKKLWDNFFCVYGFPQRLHSDQGANFESELIAELLKLSGVEKSHTSPYHPMGNGGTERFNRTLGNMLRSLPPRSKQRWPQMIQSMTFVYNCTVHETTGFAPFYLMFGRVPRLPVDLMFKNVFRDVTVCDYDAYVKSLLEDLHCAMAFAQENCTKEQKHQCDQYDKRVKGQSLSVGDRVLLANKGVTGKRKLADKWKPSVCTVVAAKPALHIYRIRDQDGCERVVHRNLLLQVNFLPLNDTRNYVDVPLSTPAPSVADVPSLSRRHDTEVAASDTAAAAAEPSLAGSLLNVSEWENGRTASWVHEQSSIGESPAQDGLLAPLHPPPASPVLAAPTGVIDPPPASVLDQPQAFPALLPCPPPACSGSFQRQNVEDGLASRFGRVIRPVCRLIESMTQLDTLLGFEQNSNAVIHV